MERERTFEIGEGDNKDVQVKSGLDVSKEYVKSKIVARVSAEVGPRTVQAPSLTTDLVKQIMRELKTTPLGVILFGYPKTKNLLTARAKENAIERDEKFDRANDPYQHCYELLPLQQTMDRSLLDKVDTAVAGQAPDGDGTEAFVLSLRVDRTAANHVLPRTAFTAAILGIETLEAQANFAKYPNKELYILTDGESEINWDGLEDAAAQMNAKRISLSVM